MRAGGRRGDAQLHRRELGRLDDLALLMLDVARVRALLAIGNPVGIGFERFERYTPCGRPYDIAAALEPYIESGCRRFNIVPAAEDLPAALAGIAAVKRLLDGRPACH